MYTVSKSFTFEAAHQLTRHLDSKGNPGKCSRLHGHSYTLIVHCGSDKLQEVGSSTGMVIDYQNISDVVDPLVESVDHRNLNMRFGGIQTTAEEICRWFWSQLHTQLPLVAVDIWETGKTRVRYTGPDD